MILPYMKNLFGKICIPPTCAERPKLKAQHKTTSRKSVNCLSSLKAFIILTFVALLLRLCKFHKPPLLIFLENRQIRTYICSVWHFFTCRKN
jgi:hypothetical protein